MLGRERNIKRLIFIWNICWPPGLLEIRTKMTFFVTNLMRHVLIMFDTRVTQAAPASAGGPGSPGRATQLRPDINCLILSDQLIFGDELTQTHGVKKTFSSCDSIVESWNVKSNQASEGEPPAPLSPGSDLSQITFHQNYRNPPPLVSHLWQKLSSMPRQHLSSGQEIDSESHLIQGFLQLRSRLKLGPPRLP